MFLNSGEAIASAKTLTKDATLPFLHSLHTPRGKLGILQRCASHYSQLGIFLLNDDDGSKIRRIELTHHYRPEVIMNEIFQEWIASGDHSWRMLIDTLKTCSLNTLSRDVRDGLRHNGLEI